MRSLILLFFCFSCITVFSQNPEDDEDNHVIRQGQNIINVYYGTNVMGAFYKELLVDYRVSDISYAKRGPVGCMFEHMINDNAGIGVEGSYSVFVISYYETAVNQQNNMVNTYKVDLKFTSVRAMFRFNYHFAESRRFDAYGFIGAGYRNTSMVYTSSNPYPNKVKYESFFPFGIKPGLGLRGFLTKNIGVHLELAAGTPLMSAGVSFAFR
jgi:outer membrane protein W